MLSGLFACYDPVRFEYKEKAGEIWDYIYYNKFVNSNQRADTSVPKKKEGQIVAL